MTDEQMSAVEHLRSGNMQLAEIKVNALKIAAEKSAAFIASATDTVELLNGVKVLETIGKMVGLTPKETTANIQINAVNGFDFIELDEDDFKQISMIEEYEEADIEDKDDEL